MSPWGNLHNRFSNPAPQRKLLALDGGGIRGIITLEILSTMEHELRLRLGRPKLCLSDYFDYIGGTSTGAIIAAGLSLGMSVKQLMDFYVQHGQQMFDKKFLVKRWKSFYNSGPLEEMLKNVFGETTDMDPSNGHFKSLLLVVTMNRTTDSPWPISNNPLAHYNSKARPDCNLKIPLYKLVRASTAAPAYFSPEVIQWDNADDSKRFVFVDGGVTPYNNPAFLLYRMATHPAYKLNWSVGEDKLLVVSVGTGTCTSTGVYRNLFDTAIKIPENLMYAMLVDQDVNCRTIGRCVYGAPIDKELHDMVHPEELNAMSDRKGGEKHFQYIRYNAELSQSALDHLNLHHIDSERVRQMDSASYIDQLREVGKAVATLQVKGCHFNHFATLPDC